jgi:hypothetical protein
VHNGTGAPLQDPHAIPPCARHKTWRAPIPRPADLGAVQRCHLGRVAQRARHPARFQVAARRATHSTLVITKSPCPVRAIWGGAAMSRTPAAGRAIRQRPHPLVPLAPFVALVAPVVGEARRRSLRGGEGRAERLERALLRNGTDRVGRGARGAVGREREEGHALAPPRGRAFHAGSGGSHAEGLHEPQVGQYCAQT